MSTPLLMSSRINSRWRKAHGIKECFHLLSFKYFYVTPDDNTLRYTFKECNMPYMPFIYLLYSFLPLTKVLGHTMFPADQFSNICQDCDHL